jgi:anti-anti-sigma factor
VENALKPLFVDDKRDILLDCAQLDYIASSGLRILVSLLKNAKVNGRKVTLKDVNDDIKNVFKLTGFLTLFDFE